MIYEGILRNFYGLKNVPTACQDFSDTYTVRSFLFIFENSMDNSDSFDNIKVENEIIST